MAKGTSSRSGPAPDVGALRRDRDAADWQTLPAEGRKGRAPKWPLTKASPRETELWRREWKRPQAIMWERNSQELEVALYVRAVAEAEKRDATTASRTLIRQLMEALGISIPGLQRNRWRIAADEVAERRETKPAQSAKDRFRVVAGEGGS